MWTTTVRFVYLTPDKINRQSDLLAWPLFYFGMKIWCCWWLTYNCINQSINRLILFDVKRSHSWSSFAMYQSWWLSDVLFYCSLHCREPAHVSLEALNKMSQVLTLKYQLTLRQMSVCQMLVTIYKIQKFKNLSQGMNKRGFLHSAKLWHARTHLAREEVWVKGRTNSLISKNWDLSWNYTSTSADVKLDREVSNISI